MRKRQTKEENSYYNAKQRCQNKDFERYLDWGGRGIEFKFSSFEEFLKEVGPAPKKTSIDRIDNDGHYEKGNVKWSTPQEQRANRRIDKRNPFGITGISIYSSKKIKTLNYVVRCREGNKYRHLYYGPDFFEACCAKKSFETRYEDI